MRNKSIQSTDPLQATAIRAAVIGLITATTGTALVLVYRGLFDLLSLSYSGAGAVACGLFLGMGGFLLFRFRDDLMR